MSVQDSDRAYGWLCAAIAGVLAGLTFYPLLRAGYASHDSMYTAIRYWTEADYIEYMGRIARREGRWWLYYHYSFTAIPYLSQSFVYYKIVCFAALTLNCLALFFGVAYASRSRFFAGFALLCYLLTVQFGANHSSFSSYFVLFHSAILFLVPSFVLFHRFLEQGRGKNLCLSSLLFLMTVPLHEGLLAYSAIYILIWGLVYFHRDRAPRLRDTFPLLPYVAITLTFLALSFAYRQSHPSQYASNQFGEAGLDPLRYFETLLRYTSPVLPGYLFFDTKFSTLFSHYAAGYPGPGPRLDYVFTHLRPLWILRASLFAVLALLLWRRTGPAGNGWWVGLLLLGGALTVVPNMLISLSGVYQQKVIDGTYVANHFTYLAGFGCAILIATLAWGAAHAFPAARFQWWRWVIQVVIAGLISGVSLITDFSNHYAGHMLAMTQAKWKNVDAFMNSQAFQELPEGSILYAPELWTAAFNPYYTLRDFSGGHLVPETDPAKSYWTKYTFLKTGRQVFFVRSTRDVMTLHERHAAANPRLFSLRYTRDDREDRYFMALGEINTSDAAHSGMIRLLSPGYDVATKYALDFKKPVKRITVNEEETPMPDAAGATISIPPGVPSEALLETLVEAEDIDLRSVAVSYGE